MPGELGFDTGPYVSVAAVCDQVIEGKDGALSLIRIIEQIGVNFAGPDAPDELPPGIAETMLVLMLRAGESRGAQVVSISLERPDGSRVGGGDTSVNFTPGQAGGINMIVPMRFEVISAGLYWIDIHINKRLMTRVPLQVNYSFTRGPAGGSSS